MARKKKIKGIRVELGIWRHISGEGYVAEINYTAPQTGRRSREQKTTHRLDLAREWRQTRKADALRGEIRKRKGGNKIPSFEKYSDEYFERWAKLEKRESTWSREERSVKNLTGFFDKKLLTEMTRKDIERYMAFRRSQGVKPGTVNRELALLKHMLKKAVDWEYLEISPAVGIRQQRVEVLEFNILAEDEMDRFIAEATPHLQAILILALNTGMRRSELFRLEWKDVDFERGFIAVHQTKNYETRYIPMNSLVREALQRHPKRMIVKTHPNGKVERRVAPWVFSNEAGQPYVNVDKGFKNSLKRAGITKHFRFHDMRHTFASWLVMKGVDLRTVAKLMGHKDIKQTMRYSHLAPDHMQGAVDVLTQRTEQQRRKQGTDGSP